MIGLRRVDRPAGAGGAQEWKNTGSALRKVEQKPFDHDNAYAGRH